MRATLHALARELGMTVHRLTSELTYNEFVDWIAFYKMQNDGPQLEQVSEAGPDEIRAMFGI